MTIKLLTLWVALFLSGAGVAQNFEVPALPATKEEFIKSEPDFIAAAKWLETTPVGTDMDKRVQVNAYVIAWLTNSPTVTLEIDAAVSKVCEGNPQLLAVFLGGCTRYCLENNYSKDKGKINTAGMKALINCYNLGGDVKKNKTLSKAIEADKEGKLEDWVKEKWKS
jgi:hypothetical protein